MFKRFTILFAYFLLVLMPLQALAGANMLICNAMMQAQFETPSTLELKVTTETQATLQTQSTKPMPCHQSVASPTRADKVNTLEKMHSDNQESSCKANCANMCALTAIADTVRSGFALNISQLFNFNSQPYASITQPNLQRPPIDFI